MLEKILTTWTVVREQDLVIFQCIIVNFISDSYVMQI